MNDKQRAEMLENVLAQMLKPIKDIPFSTIVKSIYTATEFKLVDLRDLLCDVKNEFNSDNIRLYGQDKLLASGCL